MEKEQIKKAIVQQFSLWKKTQMSLDNVKISPRDFDCWLGGYVAGISLEKEISVSDMKDVVDFLVASDEAKECGVTGTLIESLTSEKIDESHS